MLCPDHQPEFLVLGLEVEVMHTVGEVLRSFESALDKRLVDDHLGGNAHQFRSLARLYQFSHRPKVAPHPVNMQSTSENDFECFREGPG